MRTRVVPQIGQPVVVAFLAVRIEGTVVAVDPDRRGLEVATDEGEVIRFVLRRATGRFQADGQVGVNLYFRENR
jgi:hypothetical protein